MSPFGPAPNAHRVRAPVFKLRSGHRSPRVNARMFPRLAISAFASDRRRPALCLWLDIGRRAPGKVFGVLERGIGSRGTPLSFEVRN